MSPFLLKSSLPSCLFVLFSGTPTVSLKKARRENNGLTKSVFYRYDSLHLQYISDSFYGILEVPEGSI